MSTEYSVIAKPKESLASEQLSEEELDEKLPDLDSLFIEKSEEELMAILTGEEVESDEDGEDLEYDEMDVEDLKYLCKERGIKFKATATKSKLVQLLEDYDEEDEDVDEDADEVEEDEEDDDLMASVKNAVKNKRAGKR